MNLVIQKNGGKEYVYFKESFWDPKRRKTSSRIVKNFGRLDLLQKENPNILEKLRAEVEESKKNRVAEKQSVIKGRIAKIKNSEGFVFNAEGDNRIVMLGSCILKQIWNKLSLTRKLRDIKKSRKIAFDFPGAVFYMTAGRTLMPDSKLAQWSRRNQFLYGADQLKLPHLYRSIDLLNKHKDDIVKYINRQIASQYGREISVVLYDVTTYWFESQNVDALKNFGFSKDSKVNQVQVVMGLMIDQNGIPIDYELYPGNTSEFSTMIPLLEKLRDEYGIHKVIVTADRGLNSASNLLALSKMGFDYVIAYRLRNAGKDISDLITSQEGWTYRESCVRDDVSKYRITTETRTVREVNEETGEVNIEKITSNLLINYSERRAKKDARDRERLIEKAKRYEKKPSLLKTDMRRGGKSYLKIKNDELDVELDEERIKQAAIFDGYYGIVYSDSNMTPDEVLSVHHSLWQIEESFRISKSILKTRPCFHWKEPRIRGHFFICYMALVIHRLLEKEIRDAGYHITKDAIADALGAATLEENFFDKENVFYCKAQTEGDFQTIAEIVGLGTLPRIATEADVKRALKLKEI